MRALSEGTELTLVLSGKREVEVAGGVECDGERDVAPCPAAGEGRGGYGLAGGELTGVGGERAVSQGREEMADGECHRRCLLFSSLTKACSLQATAYRECARGLRNNG